MLSYAFATVISDSPHTSSECCTMVYDQSGVCRRSGYGSTVLKEQSSASGVNGCYNHNVETMTLVYSDKRALYDSCLVHDARAAIANIANLMEHSSVTRDIRSKHETFLNQVLSSQFTKHCDYKRHCRSHATRYNQSVVRSQRTRRRIEGRKQGRRLSLRSGKNAGPEQRDILGTSDCRLRTSIRAIRRQHLETKFQLVTTSRNQIRIC